MLEMKLDENGLELEIPNGEAKQYKYISIKSLRNILLQDFKVDTGPLPQGVVAFKTLKNKKRIALYRQASIQHVKYDENIDGLHHFHEFIIPTPSILWFFTLDFSNHVIVTKVFPIRDTLITKDTMLYKFPFANVYSDARVCWGDSTFLNSPLKSLVGLSSLPDIFWSRPFNIDLESSFYDGTLSAFGKLNGKTEFPMDDLGIRRTFEEAWDEN